MYRTRLRTHKGSQYKLGLEIVKEKRDALNILIAEKQPQTVQEIIFLKEQLEALAAVRLEEELLRQYQPFTEIIDNVQTTFQVANQEKTQSVPITSNTGIIYAGEKHRLVVQNDIRKSYNKRTLLIGGLATVLGSLGAGVIAYYMNQIASRVGN